MRRCGRGVFPLLSALLPFVDVMDVFATLKQQQQQQQQQCHTILPKITCLARFERERRRRKREGRFYDILYLVVVVVVVFQQNSR